MNGETSKNNAILIGFNTFDGDVAEEKPAFVLSADGGKSIDFVLCHFDPNRGTVEEACEMADKVTQTVKDMGAEIIANFEFQNFSPESRGTDGYEWANRPDGTHRLNLPAEYVAALAKNGNLRGIMYDEFEHCIANVNISIALSTKFKKRLPVFPLSKSNDAVEQSNLLDSQLKEYADGIKSMGAPRMYGEHVFPILFHKFAKAGITPNFKSQKESYSNVQYAIASGAALQYGTELCNCVDNWYRLTNPGHSAKEMYSNLVLSYLSGVTSVYVESSHVFVTDDSLNDYGKAFLKFSSEYKGKPRNYNISDLRPEIGIIRFDDTFWGQCDPVMWRKILFGNKNIKPDSGSREYIRVFNILTHGETCRNGISWGRVSPWSLRKHRSFASLNSTCVFDENVRKETLSSLKLCFLCGNLISPETLSDVAELVRDNGLVAVTTKKYAPGHIASKVKGGFCEIADGSGKWIVVDSFSSSKLREAVRPFIGNKGEMRLTFANNEIVMKISEDGEGFDVIG